MPDAVPPGLVQIGGSQGAKILLIPQHPRPLVVKIKKRLQILELVCPSQPLGIGKLQLCPVFFGQGEYHFRFQRSLQMQVQLRFGDSRRQPVQGTHTVPKGWAAAVSISVRSSGPAAATQIFPG